MDSVETFDIDLEDEDQQLSQSPIGLDSEESDDGELGVSDADDTVLEEGRRLLAEAEAKLAGVERALARLDAGNYGLCEVCGEPIAAALLSERPSLERCPAHGGLDSKSEADSPTE